MSKQPLPEINIAIIGAGVVGLAIAAELADHQAGVYVFERNNTFGLETSSRNSQVVHAGIYYPQGSLKARLCVEGKEMLYELCRRHDINHKRTGKIIIAAAEDEVGELERLREQGRRNGVEDLCVISRDEIKRLEPNVDGVAGLLSPSSGIIDCHSFMGLLYNMAVDGGAKFVFNAEVIDIQQAGDKYMVGIKEGDRSTQFDARVVINSAGLGCDRIAQAAGLDVDALGYRLHYCKGEYFSVNNSSGKYSIERLIYPVPGQASLGVHVTPALDGVIRLGPDARYVDSVDYSVDEKHREAFCESAKRFLPSLDIEDLAPDFAGIRSKLQAPGEGFRDFVISHEERLGYPGLIDLIGIESPGLAAAPAIAGYVARIVQEILK